MKRLVKKTVYKVLKEDGNTEYAYERVLGILSKNMELTHEVYHQIDEAWDSYFDHDRVKGVNLFGFVLLIVSLFLMAWSIEGSMYVYEAVFKMVFSTLVMYMSVICLNH